jgi:hypothetical protein
MLTVATSLVGRVIISHWLLYDALSIRTMGEMEREKALLLLLLSVRGRRLLEVEANRLVRISQPEELESARSGGPGVLDSLKLLAAEGWSSATRSCI